VAQTKKVRLTVTSLIENLDDAGLPSGDTERDSVATTGELSLKDGMMRLSYTEEREGAKTLCTISGTASRLTVRRTGAVEAEMRFSEGEVSKTLYRIPPFAFDAEIVTLRLEALIGDGGVKISLLYRMNIGGAEKKTKMTITAEIINES